MISDYVFIGSVNRVVAVIWNVFDYKQHRTNEKRQGQHVWQRGDISVVVSKLKKLEIHYRADWMT